MKYDVTIGIPMYNSAAFICRTLLSALSQTYHSIEILVVDDASEDDSVNIVRNLKSGHPRGEAIRLLSNSENRGVSASRNLIIDEAQGEFLYFLDSDDVITENTISLLIDNARRFNAEIVFGSYEKIETTGERTAFQYPSLQLFGEDSLAVFSYRKYAGIQASACNYLVRTSIVRDKQLRFIDTDYWEDMAFTFDLVTYISRAVLLPDITYSYYCRENSLSNYQQRPTILKEEILRNVRTIEHLKSTSSILYNKVYFPNRCFIIAMTNFYIACHVLKRRADIIPPIANSEIRILMSHPATFRQICSFRHARLRNFALFLLGKMPSFLCVSCIWIVGKIKKLL